MGESHLRVYYTFKEYAVLTFLVRSDLQQMSSVLSTHQSSHGRIVFPYFELTHCKLKILLGFFSCKCCQTFVDVTYACPVLCQVLIFSQEPGAGLVKLLTGWAVMIDWRLPTSMLLLTIMYVKARFVIWSCIWLCRFVATELQSDLVVEVGEMSFHLHKVHDTPSLV